MVRYLPVLVSDVFGVSDVSDVFDVFDEPILRTVLYKITKTIRTTNIVTIPLMPSANIADKLSKKG